MSSLKIASANVFLALIDLDKPSRASDVTDYLAGETGADSRRIASAVRRQLDQLVRKGCINKSNNLYMVIRDEKTIRERLKAIEAQEQRNRLSSNMKGSKSASAVASVRGTTVKTSVASATVIAKASVTATAAVNTVKPDVTDSSISIAGCMSIAAIPRQIRRDNPVLRSTMSEAEIKYTQRFWKKPLFKSQQ